MYSSLKISYLFLRLGLVFVFLWFGIDKFVHPNYWFNAWVPPWFLDLITKFNISGTQFIYINGVFEILVALALLLNIFTKVFSMLAIIFLVAIVAVTGFSEVIVRDVGLLGSFLAILLWPKERSRTFNL